MKKIIHKISALICILVFLCGTQVNASHVAGHEITYTCVGTNQYKVELVVYADCAGIASGSTANISVSSASCSNNFNTTLNLDAGYPVEITALCPTGNSVCNGGSAPGINQYIYSSVVTIPSSCSDWQLSWSNCCRPGSISNIANPFSNSLYAYAELDNTLSTCNNSPSFVDATPQFVGCANDTNYINFGATDIDGDSLVYSLAASANGAGTIVTYNSPLTAQNPFTGSTSIDAETGLVTLIPTTVQVGIIVVKVEEYRNGAKISEVLRDIALNISTCSNSAPIVTTVNGINQNGASATLAANQGTALSVNMMTYDVEVAAGTQTLTSSWSNLPTGATVTTGSSPTLNWTPTASDVGTHYVYLTLEDNNCPLIAQNTYVLTINVAGGNSAPIAVDDYYTILNNGVLGANVLSNDSDPDGNALSLTTTLILSPSNGTVTNMLSNHIDYVPNANFVGVDTLIYEVCDNGTPSLCASATVFIIVDHPANNTVTANIAAGSTTDVCFNTTGITSIGSINLVANGFNNATINSYDLANGCMNIKADSIATDSVTFIICDALLGVCVYNTVSLMIEAGVWPGDTEGSQDVDNADLLNIGLAYGNTGTPRNPASTVWDGYLTPDWTKVTPVSNINFKHIDCNGDGIVNVQDTVAISNNWNSSYTYNKSGAGTIPLYIDAVAPTGNNASLPIMLGNSTIPATDIYGIAFTINYDTSLVEPNTIDIAIDASWLGTAWTDLIKIHKDFYNDGMVQVAITRIDGVDIDGSGQIGNLIFTIQDDIMQRGFLKFPFEISNVRTIDANETEILTNPMQTELDVVTNTNQLNLGKFVNVFPNPVSDVLNIQSEDLMIEQITVTNIAGQVVETKTVNSSQTELYMQNLPNGIYTLSILTEKGLVHKKVNLLK